MTSPAAQPSRAVTSASHPYRCRRGLKRAARPAYAAAMARHIAMTNPLMGCVPYGPRHPQNDDSTISTPATPYTETRIHPAGAGTPDRRHGFTARRFVTA